MSRSVLIVEDEQALQDVFKLVLSSQGWDVLTANNGVDGLNQLAASSPDIVLLDLLMPVMDGKEFLRNFDANVYPKTKIIVCSNLSDSEMASEVLKLGAQRFILKAELTPQKLLKLVDDL